MIYYNTYFVLKKNPTPNIRVLIMEIMENNANPDKTNLQHTGKLYILNI